MKFRLDPFSPNGVSIAEDKPTIITGSASESTTSNTTIQQYDSDPASPDAESVWVRKTVTGGTGGGGIIASMGGGFFASTPHSSISTAYQLSYRTLENTTVRVTLS